MAGIGAGVDAAVGEGAVIGFFSVIMIMALIGGFRLISRLSRKVSNLPRELAVKGASNKLVKLEAEEVLYEKAQQEYDSGNIRSGLFAKSEATAKSTEAAAIRSQYIQLRFEQLAAEAEVLHGAANDVSEKLEIPSKPAVSDVLEEPAQPVQTVPELRDIGKADYSIFPDLEAWGGVLMLGVGMVGFRRLA